MTFQTFKMTLCDLLCDKFGSNYELSVQEITKNNHVILDGLTIKACGSRVAPTIYLNSFYEEYQNGAQLEHITDSIYEIYQNNPPDDSFFTTPFQNFSQIKDKIAYKLIHFEMNKELLKDIPHIPYLDLAIVFYCILESQSTGNATFLVRNDHLKLWKMTDQALYEIAIENTPSLLPEECVSMNLLLQNYLEDVPQDSDCSMYVLTNSQKLFGAACILYQGVLHNLAEKFQSNLYILPSSVHEVIIIPFHHDVSWEEYTSMIQEVNQTQLLEEEILSDHAYFFHREHNKLYLHN